MAANNLSCLNSMANINTAADIIHTAVKKRIMALSFFTKIKPFYPNWYFFVVVQIAVNGLLNIVLISHSYRAYFNDLTHLWGFVSFGGVSALKGLILIHLVSSCLCIV